MNHAETVQMQANQFNVLSTGKTCELLQVDPVRLSEAARTMGIQPAGTINGVCYFEASDIERIRGHLAQIQAAARPMVNTHEPSF